MATYVMSDIHGESKRFYAMLKKLRFSAEDTLYILGDVIDRGPDGVMMLRYILEQPNMVLLLGNHEQMCLDYYRDGSTFLEALRWNRNGNANTLRALEQMRSRHRDELLEKMRQLPDHMEISVGDRVFHMVHGFPSHSAYERLWSRPDYFAPAPLEGKTVIVGHTPVVAFSRYEPVRDHFRILHTPGFIDIDCGCGHSSEERRLACLRLEDMEEFYT